jgi:F-type H+-transporting ATPase subunit alpha
MLEPWLAGAAARIAEAALGPVVEQVGRIETVGDGIALASGLPDVRAGELLRVEQGSLALAQTLDADRVGCILLDGGDSIQAGQRIRGTGDVVRIPVGEALLGRVVDPMGRPLDGGPPVLPERLDPAERPAPAIIDRDAVTQPLQTGITLVDAMFALGRGQRELILGDRATGKSALATDTIINQRDSDVICVYVAIGQKSSSVAQVIEAVRRHGAPERCIFVVAGPASSPGLQWLAPFAGVTMAEFFRDRGGHALVVLDDLSKHAATHRELALLLRQPPGREAYPGDVFYLHARLLERAAKLSQAQGGGSLSALPIAETQAGNLSAYIPTNLISITDGQIVLDAKLFYEGQKPAVDIGRSVSRIGGRTQAPALRDVSGSLRLDYAQFLELELFTRFSATLDDATEARIQRGRRLRALLVQGQYAPLPVSVETAFLLALDRGLLDRLEPAALPAFKTRLGPWLQARAPDLLAEVNASGRLSDGGTRRLHGLLADAVVALAGPS